MTLAAIHDYDDVIAALRSRIDQIGCPYKSVEECAQLTEGHLGKLLGPAQVKTFGLVSFIKVMKTLGLKLNVAEHLDVAATIEEMDSYYRVRRDDLRRPGIIRRHISNDVKSLVAREMGARGGSKGKRFRLSAKDRAAINRQNVRKRKWRPVKRRYKLGRN